ncbi:hypothetical protein B8V81_2424 [Paenibacillus pasadenensis]|uniref:Uncharacterized protein n=1 Tax=Paenibacillus pasadenensis TaxID=217090 RepID=A0A2N5N0Y7_9BACL|nr:hypothetical protein B8V81_2424 [Paenibacillus pasadenensis]
MLERLAARPHELPPFGRQNDGKAPRSRAKKIRAGGGVRF